MNAFDCARAVEDRSRARLYPYLAAQSDGRFVLVQKGPLAQELQETVGDVLLNVGGNDGAMFSVELKAEEDARETLFLETWSNLNTADKASFEARGSNPGWMLKSRAAFLFYHFLSTDDLFVFRLWRLHRWAFGDSLERPGRAHRIHDFRRVTQRKRQQRNTTVGHSVPLAVLEREVGFRRVNLADLAQEATA